MRRPNTKKGRKRRKRRRNGKDAMILMKTRWTTGRFMMMAKYTDHSESTSCRVWWSFLV